MFAQYFTGIGAQRTGTTWLANYFTHHPQVCFSAVKELHYFDAVYRPDLCGLYDKNHFFGQLEELKKKTGSPALGSKDLLTYDCLLSRIKMADDPEEYKAYFTSRITEEHRVFGEITPSYSLLRADGFQAILNMFPAAKFILILRNPCDRYWSHLNLHDDRFLHFSAIEQAFNCLDNPQYYQRTDYKRIITTLTEIVDNKNILILFFEHLFDQLTLDQELFKITDFLGIDYIAPDVRPLNESKKKPLPEEYRKRIFQQFESAYQFVNLHYPDQIPKSWVDDMMMFNR